MKILRGNIHEYLVMTLDFSEPGEVTVTMIPYIENMVKYFSNHDENMRTSATPVSGHLFKTISYAEPPKHYVSTTSILFNPPTFPTLT